jgi:replicative DNA helicase
MRDLQIRFPRMERVCCPQSENFWVIGGRPGAFKTALLWNLALNMAEAHQRVAFVALEMSPAEMGLLALAKFSGLDRRRIKLALAGDRTVPFDTQEQDRWDEAVRRYMGLQLWLRIHGADDVGRTVRGLLGAAYRVRFDAVMVDHLGMIGRGSGRNELEGLADAIDSLRGLSRGEVAKGYRPLVVATSQLNREIDKGEDGEPRPPRLSDFRGSARIEHDADVVIGLQKRRKVGDDGPVSMLDGFVLKNRNGVAPEILLFEANGATGLVTERRREAAESPQPWQDREPGESER